MSILPISETRNLSLYCQHRIRSFAFAQEEIFAEKQIARRDGAGDFGDADVVHVDAAVTPDLRERDGGVASRP